MGTRQTRPPASAGAEGLSRLLEAEARLEARVAATQSEAAALVMDAHRAVAIRHERLARELEAMADSHRRQLEQATQAQLDDIDRRADARLAVLRTIPAARRAAVVQGVVATILEELVGKGAP